MLDYAAQPEFSHPVALELGEISPPLYILFLSQWDDDENMTILSNKDL